jgi:broad specificity phosphatase PhoE
MQITSWWWVRHAPVTGHDGRMYGASDVPADVTDDEAFGNLATRLPEDAVWVTSHLQRARHTAEAIAAAGLDMPEPLIEPDLGEQNFGEWQGLRYEDLHLEVTGHDVHNFWFAAASFRPPGGESFLDVVDRVRTTVERLTQAHRGRHIVAVAHGGSIRAALVHALDLDPNRGLAISTDNLATTRIDHVEGPGLGGNWRLAFTNARAR